MLCVCILAPHRLRNRWIGVVERTLGAGLHAPKPGQHVGGEHGDSRACRDAGQSLLGARFTVGELVSANHDGDQAGHLGYRAGEEGLHCGEAGVERRLSMGDNGQQEDCERENARDTRPKQESLHSSETMGCNHFAPPPARLRQLWRKSSCSTKQRPMIFRESVIPFGYDAAGEGISRS